MRQPGERRGGLAVPQRPPAGDRRLAALEPHLRRQPQLQHDAAPRRHASTSTRASRCRRSSAARWRTCARSRPTVYFNVPRGYAALARSPGAGRGAAAEILRPPRSAVLCGRRIAAEPVGSAGGAGHRDARPQGAVHLLVGAHRDGARHDDGALRHRPTRQHRRARAGHGREARPGGRQAGDPRQGSERDARLLQGARARRPRRSTRRAGSGPAMPCAWRSRTIQRPACCSTAARPRTSSSRPAPGSMSARCARSPSPPARR